jgi:NADH:ubiquinone oxidoreductase subunit 5 (subunit L)/multisubunit Na+/H+ antiporter MnhA subunit
MARRFATFTSWIDRTFVDGFVNAVGGFTGATGGLLKYLQTGNVQWYAVLLFVGVVALTIVFVRMA